MAKLKCGTCRFFQEAGLAGSGWCHHPQRKVSSDVLIMVRRSELACRDDWSRNLWEPAGEGADGEPAFQRPPEMGPLPPASTDQLRTMLVERQSASDSEGEDVLLSEARIVSEPRVRDEEWHPPARSVSSGAFDPRTAIFRAREAYRERARARAAAARQAAGVEAARVAQAEIEVSSGRVAEIGDATHETEPDELSLASTDPAARAVASVTSEYAGGGLEGQDSAHEPSPGLNDSGFEPAAHGASGKELGAASESPQENDSMADASVGVCVPDDVTDEGAHSQQGIQGTPVRADEQLPAWFRTDLPRLCRACRDYRPSTDGQRGWCANSWAFTHRRLVQGDDVAPCHSAIGDWWVPVDDVWLVAADVSAHGRATPLLDRYVAEAAAQRRRS